MFCPIFINAMIQTGRTDVAGETLCLKEECELWYSTYERCSVRDIAVSLDDLGKLLSILVARVPKVVKGKE